MDSAVLVPDFASLSRVLNLSVRRRWTSLAFGAALAVSVGCGGGTTGTVEGQVMRSDGTPVVNARVTARAQGTGNWASDVTDEEGSFELLTSEKSANIPAGDYQVSVVEDEGDWDHPTKPTIAAKYNTPAASGLEFNLDAGESKTLELKLDPR